MSSASLPSYPSVPSDSSRLQSAPSATRSLSPNVDLASTPAARHTCSLLQASAEAATTASGPSRLESLHLRLSAHPAIQRLQQLEEARDDEVQEDGSEDDDDEGDHQENEEIVKAEAEDQPPRQTVEDEYEATSSYGLPAVDEAEHAPLAGLVTAFPFVQQFMPQPSRAEKKKQFIQRIHASHQLTIPNSYSPTGAQAMRPALQSQPSFSLSHVPVGDCSSPPLPAALPKPFRSVSSSLTVSSDDSHEELSSEHDSCSQPDCSSAALADTFASLSPHFASMKPSAAFSYSSPAPSAPFFLSPVLSSSAGPLPILQSPLLHCLPAVFSSTVLSAAGDPSLCPDELQLGESAWNDGGHWMGDW